MEDSSNFKRILSTYQAGNCNLVNPNDYFERKFVTPFYDINLLKHNVQLQNSSYSQKIFLKARLKNMAKEDYLELCREALSVPFQPELIELLTERKKKAQQKLIKNLIFTTDTLLALPLYAWDNYKMKFSAVIVDHLPKELDTKVFPKFLRKMDDDNFEYEGHTDLTKGEMKLALSKRNRIISEFIGDENIWYCFFRTMSGIRGTEEPHIDQPHLHFISSAWGIKREDVITQLKSYRYKLNAETIQFVPWDV